MNLEDLIGDDDVAALLAGADDDAVADALAMSAGEDVELVGDDVIGGLPAGNKLAMLARLGIDPSRVLRKVQARRANAALAARNAIGVRQRGYTRGGETPLGFSQLIAAGASATISIQLPVPFSPKRLLIPESVADSFEITDLSTGMDRLIVGSNPVPAASFTPNASPTWRLPTIQTGQLLTMAVRNISGADATMRGAWHGTYAT